MHTLTSWLQALLINHDRTTFIAAVCIYCETIHCSMHTLRINMLLLLCADPLFA